MKYYLHDTNSFSDEKITMLFMQYGYEGLGLFYTLLEKIGSQEKPIKTNVLKRQLQVGKKLEKCWSFMEEIGLISSNNDETFNERILSYSETYQIKKEKTREKVAQWRENQSNKKNVTSYVPVSNLPKVKESKVKESKENNIVLPHSGEFEKTWNEWVQLRKEIKKPLTETTIKKQLEFLGNKIATEAVAILNQSIQNQWQGLFELKTNGHQQQQPETINLLDGRKVLTPNH